MFVFGADYNLEIFSSCGGGSSSLASSGTELALNGGRTDAGFLCRAATPPQAHAAKLAGKCARLRSELNRVLTLAHSTSRRAK